MYKELYHVRSKVLIFLLLFVFVRNVILRTMDPPEGATARKKSFYFHCSKSEISKKNSFTYKYIVQKKPHMLIIEMSDGTEDGNKPTPFVKNFKKQLSYKIGDMEYKLDSIGIRDNGQRHICSLITINDDDYMFDGENFSPLFKKKWRHLLNKNQNFKITPSIPEIYNLTKGYQVLMYYRTK